MDCPRVKEVLLWATAFWLTSEPGTRAVQPSVITALCRGWRVGEPGRPVVRKLYQD
jgi:hypothetical protein